MKRAAVLIFKLFQRVHSLQLEVRTLRAKEHEDTVTMEKAIEQAEENIQRTVVSVFRDFFVECLLCVLKLNAFNYSFRKGLLMQRAWFQSLKVT